MKEQPSKSLAALPPLPELKILRTTYCSQDMADNAIKFIQWKNPDLLNQMSVLEKTPRNHNFFQAVEKIVLFLKESDEGQLEIPSSILGMLDLMHELSRRIRKAHDLPEIELRGCSLIERLGVSLPPMPNTKLQDSSIQSGLTQEDADKVLQYMYKSKPELFFYLAEEMRHQMALAETEGTFRLFLKDTLDRDLSVSLPFLARGCLLMEARCRLRKMCEISI